MSGKPVGGGRRGRENAGARAVRIVMGILFLLLLLLLAVVVMRRFHAEPGGGQAIVKKAPRPPESWNARKTALPESTAADAVPSRRDDDDALAVSRGNAEGHGREPGERPPSGPGRGAPSAPVILDDGDLRIFIDGTGTVSLPVVLRGTGSRILVERAGNGRPAEVQIATVPDTTAAVSVLSGGADVAAGGRRVRVGAGAFTTLAGGAPPAPPESLPPPPDLATPSDNATFLYKTLPPRISFSWLARGPVDGYRFVLARDPGFLRIVLDERVAGCRVTQSRLEEGTYYWRVSAVRKGAAGPPGDAARFRIVRRGTPPNLMVQSMTRVDGGKVCLVTGTTDPGAKVFVAGIPVPVTGTGSFSCRLRLDGTVGAIVVEAVDPLGNAAYRSQWVN